MDRDTPMTINTFKIIYILCILTCIILCIVRYMPTSVFDPTIRYRAIGNTSEKETQNNLPDKKIEYKDQVSKIGNKTSLNKVNNKKQCSVYNVKQKRCWKPNISPGITRSSETCTKKLVILSKKVLPITGLVSFPGSGNTWMRHLIQQMTGLGTSSMYCDSALKNGGFPYECISDRRKTIVVKTHNSEHLYLFRKVVLLVRNPYDALLSFANFNKDGHTGRPSTEVLAQVIADKFEQWVRRYTTLTRDIIAKFNGPVHVVQYERLVAGMAHELRKLATFLNVSVSDKEIYCTVKLQEGNFKRQKSEAKHKELLHAIYTKDKLVRLQEAARYSEKLLKDAYHIDIELGGATEKLLFQSS